MATSLLKVSAFRALAVPRQFIVAASLNNKSNTVGDPVKNLFLTKLKEYQTKLGAGKIVVTAETNKDLAEELMRLKHIYGSGDLSKFPEFQFKDE